MKSSGLTVLSNFQSMADAQIAKGLLDEAQIESMIRSDNAGGMYPPLGAVELIVRDEDVQRAAEALQPLREPLD